MTDRDKTNDYAVFLLDGETKTNIRTFSFSTERGDLVSRFLDKNNGLQDSNVEEPVEDNDTDFEKDTLASLLDSALKLGLSQVHLITIADASMPLFKGSLAKFDFIDPVTEHADVVEEGHDYKIWGIKQDQVQNFLIRLKRFESLEEALNDLPAAVLLSLVATFDSFVADTVREMLQRYPDRYSSSDRTMSVRDVLSLSSFDELISRVIDDDIYSFSRGSHEDQVKYIEKQFGVPVGKHWTRYPDFIEIFERRNLIAHGEKTFNSRYVRICKDAGHLGLEEF